MSQKISLEKRIDPKIPLNEEEKRLLESVDKNKELLYELLGELVKINSQNPSEFIYRDRNKIMKFTEEKMKEFGFETELFKAPFKSKDSVETVKFGEENDLYYQNLVAKFDSGTPGNIIQFCGHLDTVPFVKNKWDPQLPPLGSVIKDGKLYGRGACDMKSGVACQMMAMKLLKDSGLNFKGKLQMWFTPDEETHGAYGSAFMVKNFFESIKSDATIISEPSSVPPLISPAFVLGEKGPVWLQLDFFGASGHGSMPKPKSNAINKAVRFMVNAHKLKIKKANPPLSKITLLKSLLKRYNIGVLLKIMKVSKNSNNPLDEDGPGINSLFTTTFSFDEIQAGTKVNVIPDVCSLKVDFRALPGISAKDILSAIGKYCIKLGYRVEFPEQFHTLNPQQKDGKIRDKKLLSRPVDVKISIITTGMGSFEDPHTIFGDLLTNAFESVYGVKAVHFFSSGFTDAGNMREAGLKNIFVFGPLGGNFHSKDEYAVLDSMINVTKVYLLAAYRYLS